jgi:hypothetical protein
MRAGNIAIVVGNAKNSESQCKYDPGFVSKPREVSFDG